MGWVRIGLTLALVGWGCGGAVVGPSPGFATAPDSSVLTPAVRKVTLTMKGGGIGSAPCSPAGVCLTQLWSYTLWLDTKRLAFDGSIADQLMAVPVMADVALSAPQFETLTAAARAVTVSARTECGADAPQRELRVESADAALTYGDDIYACVMNYDHFVKYDGLDNLQTVFVAIAP